jgi:hypothetical protein
MAFNIALGNSGSAFNIAFGGAPPAPAFGQVLVSGSWYPVSAMQVCISEAWKEVTKAQVCVGESWKELV